MATTPKQLFVILCGGTGPRLWPLSTTSHPKQLLPILSDNSLLEETVSRLLKLTNKENIFITTNKNSAIQISKLVSHLIPKENIFAEPDKKNTALAVYFTLSLFSKHDPQTVVTFLPADHFISPINKFATDIKKVAKIAIENSSIVTIGIHPSFPNPSFGYILDKGKFVEKPNKIRALKYIVDGALWNSGIYTATINTYLSEFKKHYPSPSYKKSPPLSFDVAISQKTRNIDHIKASFDWSDIGEWGSIYDKSKKDSDNIATINKQTKYLNFDSHRCLVASQDPDKLIGLVGVNNLSIIDTPKGLLICSLDRGFEVRDLVKKMVDNPKLKHYFVDNNEK